MDTSSADERKKILEKIRAMARLADPGNGGFEEEIKNAARMMQRLMDRYQVSITEVMQDPERSKDGPEFVKIQTSGRLGVVKPWHWALARSIASITSTKHYSSPSYGETLRDPKHKKRSRVMSFFGTRDSAQLAADLYDEWVVLIDDMAKQATAEYCQRQQQSLKWIHEMKFYGVKQFRHLPGLGTLHPNVWRNSWLMGVCSGIAASIAEQQRARDSSTSNAIVLVTEALNLHYEAISRSFKTVDTTGRGDTNWEAHSSGRQVGEGLNLNSVRFKKIGG